jgi:hypothetical protein
MKCGSIVRINDNNEWNGLYGVVRYIRDNIAYIFCVCHPTDLYVATEQNNICIIEE